MNTWIRREYKEVYKLICITHPYDLYDLLADNNAEPDLPLSMLTYDQIIELCMDFAIKNGTDLFYELHAKMEDY